MPSSSSSSSSSLSSPSSPSSRSSPSSPSSPSPRTRRRFPRPLAVLAGGVGLAIGMLAVLALREATLSTHQPVPENSQTEVIVTARARGAETTQSLAEIVEAQLQACRLEVNSDVVGEVAATGDGRFRAVLSPSMDETNRRQFRGCLEDWLIDHVRLDVVTLHDLP
jgi:hypothetical protein